MEVSGQLHAPAALLPEKKPPIPTGQEAEWSGWSGLDGEERKIPSMTLPGIEPRSSSP